MDRHLIADLCAEVREAAESAQNQKRLTRWQPGNTAGGDVSVTEGASVWHGVPQGRAKEGGEIPFTVDPEIVLWSKILGFNMKQYYTDPACYLANNLKMKLYRGRTFGDDSYITKNISIFVGVILEPSMFGVQPVYGNDTDPWNATDSFVITGPEDLKKMKKPDFYKSGVMPLTHRFYREIRENLPDDFSVSFPIWGRGPWGVAQHLMGFENLYVSVLTQPEFVHDLMKFIVECQMEWITEMARFLDTPIPIGVMYNDEVNCQLLSPQIYEDFVFPYESRIAEFHGGLSYWHSCGKTHDLLPMVKKLHGLEMYDVSAWTDWEKSIEELKDTGIALEVRMHPVEDVLFAEEKNIVSKLKKIRVMFDGLPVTVRADGQQLMRDLETDVQSIKRWSEIAEDIFHRS